MAVTKKNELELMANVHALCVSVVRLTGSMMVLESSFEAIAKQQRDILVRLGDDPKEVAASFNRAKSDAFFQSERQSRSANE